MSAVMTDIQEGTTTRTPATSGPVTAKAKAGCGMRLRWGVAPRRRILGVVSIFVALLVWSLLATVLASPYLPHPGAVARTLLEGTAEEDFLGFTMAQHITASLQRIVYGFLLAAVLAVPLGLITGWSQTVSALVTPAMELLRPIPPLAWIPFAIFFFGSPFDAIFLVVLASFFPIVLSTHHGVREIDPVLIAGARTLGARRLQLFSLVVVPAALGSIITGARVGLGVAWMSIVAAEMVGVEGGGLGVYVWSSAEVGLFDRVFAGMVMIGALGLLLTAGMGLIERRFVGEGMAP